MDARHATAEWLASPNACADDCIYLADDLGQGSALTWVNAELALALDERGVPVFVNGPRRCRRLCRRRDASQAELAR